MDKTTFGKAAVALHLVDHLNRVGNAKLSQKVAYKIASTRSTLYDLVQARQLEAISEKTWNFTINALHDKIKAEAYDSFFAEIGPDDEMLTQDLLTNLLIGEIRRAREAASLKDRRKEVKKLIQR